MEMNLVFSQRITRTLEFFGEISLFLEVFGRNGDTRWTEAISSKDLHPKIRIIINKLCGQSREGGEEKNDERSCRDWD